MRLVEATDSFNFSSRGYLGARHARGEHLLLLNDDIEVIRPDWLDALLELSQEPENGVVGGKLRFPNGAYQELRHRTRSRTARRHTVPWLPGHPSGPRRGLIVNRDFSAVTGACQMVRADVFAEVNGYDESFVVDLGDVDSSPPGAGGGLSDRDLSACRADALRGCESHGGSGDVDTYGRGVVEGHRALLEPARPVRAGLHAQLPDPIRRRRPAYARAGNDRLSASTLVRDASS